MMDVALAIVLCVALPLMLLLTKVSKKPRRLRREALLLGDSITQYGNAEKDERLQPLSFPAVSGAGWTALVAERYSRKVDLINRGLSGYNTRKVRAVLELILESTSDGLLFATLFLGANDEAPDSEDALCSHVPVAEFEENLTFIARQLRKKADHLVIIAPPPISAGSCTMGRTNEVVALYAAASMRVAHATGTIFVDIFNEMRSADLDSLLVDGLHLSAKGNAFLASKVLNALEQCCPSDDIPWDLPGRRDLDRFSPKVAAKW